MTEPEDTLWTTALMIVQVEQALKTSDNFRPIIIVWRAVWGKSQRATNIHFALLFTLFRTKSRNSRGPLDLRNFVVSAQKLETRSATFETTAQLSDSARNSFAGERNYSGWAQHFIRGDYGTRSNAV